MAIDRWLAWLVWWLGNGGAVENARRELAARETARAQVEALARRVTPRHAPAGARRSA